MYKKNIPGHICFFAAALVLFFCTPLWAQQENIDPDDDGHQWAWGENVGWLNFEPSLGPGVTVTNDAVTGSVWANAIGWINLSPAGYDGVKNDSGTLSGWAWGENVGWISFSCDNSDTCDTADYGVTIDGDGLFDGYAWSKNIGWINFALLTRPDAAVKTAWPDGPSPCDANAQCQDDSDCDAGEACHNCICVEEEPSAITLTVLEAIPGNRTVTLEWETADEEDHMGFNVYRAESEGGTHTQINTALIPAEGLFSRGATYRFVDDGLRNRKIYYYKLEEIDDHGDSTLHGPVSATPRLLYGMGR